MGRGQCIGPLLRLLAAGRQAHQSTSSRRLIGSVVACSSEGAPSLPLAVLQHDEVPPSSSAHASTLPPVGVLHGASLRGYNSMMGSGQLVQRAWGSCATQPLWQPCRTRCFHGSAVSRHGGASGASAGLEAGRDSQTEDEKVLACDRITKIGAVCNVGLAALKTGAGYISGSSALMADGAASLSDLVSDGITLWSMRASRQPSNQEHPYGHGRLETIGTLGVAGFLLTTGAGFCYTSLQGLYDAYLVSVGAAAPEGMGMLEGPLWVAMAAGFASLVVKEGLFRATKSAGERAGSKVVIANAWHHRTDAISSLVAVLGVGGAMAGFPLLDPLAGVAVSALIVKMGVSIGWDSMHELADRGLEGSILKEIRASAEAVDGVIVCQSLRGRRMGPFVSIDMLIEVNPWTSVSIAHNIRSMVAHRVRSDHDQVAEVFVAAVPKGVKPSLRGNWTLPKLSPGDVEANVFRVVCAKFPEVLQVSFMHTHVLPANQQELVVVLGFTMDIEKLSQAPAVAARLQEALQAIDGVAEADIHLDLTYIPTESFSSGDRASSPLSFRRGDCPEENPCS